MESKKPATAKKSRKTEKSTTRSLAQAQADSRRALIDRGGKLIHIRIEPDAVAALDDIKARMGFRFDREAIAYALLVARDDTAAERARLRRRA